MAKRGKGLQRALEDDGTVKPKSSRSFNQGKGQEITGVTLPGEGSIKGWEFGEGVKLAVANVGGKFYALQVSKWRTNVVKANEALTMFTKQGRMSTVCF